MLLSDIMVDTRFHRFAGPFTIGAILDTLGRSDLLTPGISANLPIGGAADLELANPSDLALAAHTDYIEQLKATSAGVVVVLPSLAEHVPPDSAAIVTEGATAADTSNPGGAFSGRVTLSAEATPPYLTLRSIIKT